MLNHRCDVYHIRRADTSPGYNLPSSPAFSYSDEADIADLRCHFSVNGGSRSIDQHEPHATYSASVKLVVPWGTDIRLNDKIVDRSTGYAYTAEIPIPIRSHHAFVMLHRTAGQEPL